MSLLESFQKSRNIGGATFKFTLSSLFMTSLTNEYTVTYIPSVFWRFQGCRIEYWAKMG